MADKLEGATRDKAIAELKGWSDVKDRNAIFKEFNFKNFRAAFAFMNESALLAEKMDHHPEWFNVYNRVEVTLTTHSAEGVSDLDIKLASEMDKILQS